VREECGAGVLDFGGGGFRKKEYKYGRIFL